MRIERNERIGWAMAASGSQTAAEKMSGQGDFHIIIKAGESWKSIFGRSFQILLVEVIFPD
ncbi:hypothetical protein [Neisseria shayeganii]|uniref:Uncharacterized protein n=1 Tax=Neisseria shayeganii TaxID=607712 RepID=A0A7D7RLZ7_9NEIS|nr:hypothetical protein [Neisseria shayeganii]QMT39802.1 hypothetical protein H3L94_07955 [Neisseria shayeganii]